jgi:protein TonB
MEIKKNPKFRLENYSFLFLQIGLVLSLFTVYILLEHKTYKSQISEFESVHLSSEEEEDAVVIHRIQPVSPPLKPPPVISEVFEIIKNTENLEETIIQTTETDEHEAVEAFTDIVDMEGIVEYQEVEEITEDVPFTVIEDVPVFPGCKGNRQELKVCFSKKIREYVSRKFDVNLANDLGLSEGRKRISVMFTIDTKGAVTEIKARAPHPRLEREVIKIIKSLPKMTPGKQRGTPVNVSYYLPITFKIIIS